VVQSWEYDGRQLKLDLTIRYAPDLMHVLAGGFPENKDGLVRFLNSIEVVVQNYTESVLTLDVDDMQRRVKHLRERLREETNEAAR
jgi:hypothetical protein